MPRECLRRCHLSTGEGEGKRTGLDGVDQVLHVSASGGAHHTNTHDAPANVASVVHPIKVHTLHTSIPACMREIVSGARSVRLDYGLTEVRRRCRQDQDTTAACHNLQMEVRQALTTGEHTHLPRWQ